MLRLRSLLPVALAILSGCNPVGLSVKRQSELNCPTDIRQTVPWCAGEDAIFRCPCGPAQDFYGHKPTCWRTWPAPASVWRDSYCGGLQTLPQPEEGDILDLQEEPIPTPAPELPPSESANPVIGQATPQKAKAPRKPDATKITASPQQHQPVAATRMTAMHAPPVLPPIAPEMNQPAVYSQQSLEPQSEIVSTISFVDPTDGAATTAEPANAKITFVKPGEEPATAALKFKSNFSRLARQGVADAQ